MDTVTLNGCFYCRFYTNTLGLLLRTNYELVYIFFCINEEALWNSMFSVVLFLLDVFKSVLFLLVLFLFLFVFLLFINLKVHLRFYGYFSYAGNEVLTFSGRLNFLFFTFVTYVTSVFFPLF